MSLFPAAPVPGKTTLLNAMSHHHIGTHGTHRHDRGCSRNCSCSSRTVIRLETRPPSLEGTGQVTQRDLLRNSLRMRPDRASSSERFEGEEAFDMLQAMNTGHDGSISTVHANTTRDALTRVENMVQMGQVNLPSRAIRTQIVAAIDMIVHVERMRDGQRRVMQLTEVCGMEGEVITTNDVALFEYQQEDAQGRISGTYKSTQAIPKFKKNLAYFGFDRAWSESMRQI